VIEPLAGARYTTMENELTFANVPAKVKKTADWTDLMAGLRYRWQISERWKMILRGDIAGFGSNFTWNAAGLFDFQPWKHVSIFAGYRVMDTDYDEESGQNKFEYKVQMRGPLAGLNITW
jgi:hypothetical protein